MTGPIPDPTKLADELERLARRKYDFQPALASVLRKHEPGGLTGFDWCDREAFEQVRQLLSLVPTILAALRRPTPPSAVAKDALVAAYTAGATDTHNWWAAGNVEREADFTEAAHDYADAALASQDAPSVDAIADEDVAADLQEGRPMDDTMRAVLRATGESEVERVLRILKNWHLSTVQDEEGNGYPLLDAVSTPGTTVATGEEELGEIAFAIVASLPRESVAETVEPGESEVERVAKEAGLFPRVVTHERALQAAHNFIDAHFNNREGKGVLTGIPAREDHDDLLLTDYIKQQRALASLPSRESVVAETVAAIVAWLRSAPGHGKWAEKYAAKIEHGDWRTRVPADPTKGETT
jgi:hypothetical protein